MKLLVVGGAGFVGSVVVPRLIARGHDVDVADLLWFGNHLPPTVRLREVNVMDIAEQDLRGYEQVIFLAGVSNDPMAEHSPAKNFVFNAAAPAYLAYIAKRAGVRRYIYASSCSVYGFDGDGLFDETSTPRASYPYGISKLQGEFAALSLSDATYSVIVLRKGTICGYSPRMRLDLVINAMFRSAITDGVITVNNPTIWRPILSIEDAASAYVRSVECGATINGVFNVAGDNYQLEQLGEIVQRSVGELMGVKARLRILDIPDVRNYRVSCTKAAEILEFTPSIGPRGIVEDLVRNLEAFSDFDNPSYYNLLMFRALEEAERAAATTQPIRV